MLRKVYVSFMLKSNICIQKFWRLLYIAAYIVITKHYGSVLVHIIICTIFDMVRFCNKTFRFFVSLNHREAPPYLMIKSTISIYIHCIFIMHHIHFSSYGIVLGRTSRSDDQPSSCRQRGKGTVARVWWIS